MASRRPVSKRTRVRPQNEPVATTPIADAERSTPEEADIATPEGSEAVAIGMLLAIVTIVALFMVAFIISA